MQNAKDTFSQRTQMYCNRCAIRIARQAAKQGKKTGSGAGHSGGAGASKQAKAGTARKASQGHNAEGDEPAAKRKRQASQRKPEKEHQVDEMESKPAAEAAKGAENSPDTNDTKEKTGQLISSVSASEGTGPADVAFEALCSGTTDSLSGGGLIEEDGGLLDIPSVEGVGGSDAVLQEPIPTAGGMRTSHSFVWTFGDDQPVHS